MWNQNNGNGNGYGQADDVYGRLNNTKEIGGARFPFLDGSGTYALCTLEEFQHSSDGPSARALFEVLTSKDGKHAVGSYVVKIWKLVKPPFKPGMETDADRFADFCRKLKGAPAGYPIGNDIRVLMKERNHEQLARGTVIEAVGVLNKKGDWTNIYWNHVQQTPQDIAQMRQRLEQKGIPSTTSGPQQPAQNQYTNAPHPSQAYVQQPPPVTQPGYGPTPQQQVQGAPNPAYYPSAPAQPAAPQHGGFLAQLPPANTGNNGNGGGW